jgi:hypothetical protein
MVRHAMIIGLGVLYAMPALADVPPGGGGCDCAAFGALTPGMIGVLVVASLVIGARRG